MISYINEALFKQNTVHKDWSIISDNISLTNSDIFSEQISITESICSEDNMIYGSCEASLLQFTTTNVTNTFKGRTLYVSICLNHDYEHPFELGSYIVAEETLSADKTKKEIKAYDALWTMLNKDVWDWYNGLTFPMSLKNFRDSFFNYLNISQETTNLVNDSILVQKTIDTNILSGVEVLKAICEVNGVFGHIRRDGIFEYKELSNTSVYTIDASMFTSNVEYEEYEAKSISKLQIRQESGDIGVIVGSGDNSYIIEDNFILYGLGTSELTPIANTLLNKISGHAYRPCKVNCIGNPCLEAGDRIIVRGKNRVTTPYYHESGRTNNGVTYTINANGQVVANGTATAVSTFYYVQYSNNFKLTPGKYFVSGCPANGGSSTYRLAVRMSTPTGESASNVVFDTGSGANFTVSEEQSSAYVYSLLARVENGYTANNLTFNIPELSKQIAETYVMSRTIKGLQALTDEITAEGDEVYPDDVNGVHYDIIQLKGKSNVLEKSIEETRSTITNVEEDLQTEIVQTANGLQIQIDEIHEELNGEINYYEREGVPTLLNYPYWDFTTAIPCNGTIRLDEIYNTNMTEGGDKFPHFYYSEADKKAHRNNICFDNTTGISYKFAIDNGNWYWKEITDSEYTYIMARVSALEATAETLTIDYEELSLDLHDNYWGITDTQSAISQSASEITASVALNYQTISGMSDYYTSAQTDTKITQTANAITSTVSETYQTISGMSDYQTVNDMANYYDKSTSDGKYQTQSGMNNYYTKTQTDSQITQKGNEITMSVSETYQTKSAMSNYYNKTTSDGKYQTQSGMSNYYTKSGADGKFQTQAAMSSYYTSSQTDAKISASKSAIELEVSQTYQTQSGMSAYQTISGMSNYQTVAAMDDYYDKDTADSTFFYSSDANLLIGRVSDAEGDISDINGDISSINSDLSNVHTEISAKVSETYGNSSSAFSWVLKSTGFLLKNNGTTKFQADSSGVYINGTGTFTGTVNANAGHISNWQIVSDGIECSAPGWVGSEWLRMGTDRDPTTQIHRDYELTSNRKLTVSSSNSLQLSGTGAVTISTDDVMSLTSRELQGTFFNAHKNLQVMAISAGDQTMRFSVVDRGTSSAHWAFTAGTDGLVRLGDSNNRWNQIYSTNSTISTSDRTLKKEINKLDSEAKDFIMKLNPVSYKLSEGQSGRTHYGLIAQDVEETMNEMGMTSIDFAGFCKDAKTREVIKEIEEDGRIFELPEQEIIEGEYIYGLRYEEFIAPMIKTIQIQQKEIEELKRRVYER